MVAALSSSASSNQHGPRSPRGQQTIKAVEFGMEKGTAHCLPELIELVQAICVKGTDIQVSDLCELVEKHPGLLSKIISAATTLGYNPSRMEITTLNHAIQVIGFDRIRSLVTTLMLVRHAQDAEHLREQKEAAICAVVSGLAAQLVSRERKVADAEMAFVAASLRHLGRLLMSTYLRSEYQKVMALVGTSKRSEKDLFREFFGLTPVELSRAILLKAKFPESLLDTLHEPDAAPKKKKRGEENQVNLMDVSIFAERLTEMTMSRRLAQELFPQRARSLCASFPEDLDYSESEMMHLLGNIGEALSAFTEQMGFGLVASDAVQMCRHRQGKADMPGTLPVAPPPAEGAAAPAETGLPVEPSPTPSPSSLVEVPARPASAPAQPVPAEVASTVPAEPAKIDVGVETWKEGLFTLSQFLAEPGSDPMRVLGLAASIIREGFRAPEYVLLAGESDKVSFAASQGDGKVFQKLRGRVVMKRGERTALGVCQMRRENVLIHDTGDPKTAAYLPEWGNRDAGWGSFIAVPFHDNQETFAIALIAWPVPMQLGLNADQTKLLRSITSMVTAVRRAA